MDIKYNYFGILRIEVLILSLFLFSCNKHNVLDAGRKRKIEKKFMPPKKKIRLSVDDKSKTNNQRKSKISSLHLHDKELSNKLIKINKELRDTLTRIENKKLEELKKLVKKSALSLSVKNLYLDIINLNIALKYELHSNTEIEIKYILIALKSELNSNTDIKIKYILNTNELLEFLTADNKKLKDAIAQYKKLPKLNLSCLTDLQYQNSTLIMSINSLIQSQAILNKIYKEYLDGKYSICQVFLALSRYDLKSLRIFLSKFPDQLTIPQTGKESSKLNNRLNEDHKVQICFKSLSSKEKEKINKETNKNIGPYLKYLYKISSAHCSICKKYNSENYHDEFHYVFYYYGKLYPFTILDNERSCKILKKDGKGGNPRKGYSINRALTTITDMDQKKS